MRRFALILALSPRSSCGCGGDDEPARTVTAPAERDAARRGDEYSFDPSAIVVRGAGTLTVTLRNEGSLAHNLKVLRGDEEVGGTPSLPGGRTESARLNLEHGSYRDRLHGRRPRGARDDRDAARALGGAPLREAHQRAAVAGPQVHLVHQDPHELEPAA